MNKRVKALLPQVPSPTRSEVDKPSIPAVCFRQGVAQPELVGRNQDQVHMIRHQTISQNLSTTTAAKVRQQPAILDVVAIVEKNLLTSITSLCHMMGQSWRNNSWESCHVLVNPSPMESTLSHST